MKRTVEYLGKSEDGFAEYEISESIENDSTSKVYKPEKIKYPRPKEVMKLNKEEFFKNRIRDWDNILGRFIRRIPYSKIKLIGG